MMVAVVGKLTQLYVLYMIMLTHHDLVAPLPSLFCLALVTCGHSLLHSLCFFSLSGFVLSQVYSCSELEGRRLWGRSEASVWTPR